MRRVLGWSLALLLLGGLIGGVAAYAASPDPDGHGVAVPVPGSSPSVPTTPGRVVPPPEDDIDYPALRTPTTYTRHRISNGYQPWSYAYPKGWQAFCVTDSGEERLQLDSQDDTDCVEIRYRPEDEPPIGGYSLRVKAVGDHATPEIMAAAKLSALRESPDLSQVRVLKQADGTLYVTLRTGGNLERYNYFAWFAAPGATSATLEMSVAGRAVDDNGLRGLMDAFADRLRAG